MKAAGPSQSWAQRLRVEYITLKSLTPALSTALSAGLSSAMQPSRTSTRSPTNLPRNNSGITFSVVKTPYRTQCCCSGSSWCCCVWIPVPSWGYLGSVGLWGVSVTGLYLDTAIQQEGTEVAINLQTSHTVFDCDVTLKWQIQVSVINTYTPNTDNKVKW